MRSLAVVAPVVTLVAAACRGDLLTPAAFTGAYSLVAIRSAGDTAFTGSLIVTAPGTVTGNLSNLGSVTGQAVVRGDSLDIVVWGHISISVGLAGVLRAGLLVGTWTYGADGCWQTPCPQGPFTARRSV